MKKIYTHCIVAALVLLSAWGCSKEEISAWKSDQGLVWFTDTIVDYSFLGTDIAEGESSLVPIPLTVAAVVGDRDRTVNVEVVRQPADNRTQFEVQAPVTFRAGYAADTMYVRVFNSANLNEAGDTIAFRVASSADFEPGLVPYREVKLCLFNGYTRPDWWNEDLERTLGYFTQLKMEVFLAVTGSDEEPVDNWYGVEATYLLFMLNDYVEQNDIRYPDDDPNKPGEHPVFDFWEY